MKKRIVLALAVTIVLTLAACGGSPAPASSAAPAPAPASSAAPAPSAEPAPASSAASTSSESAAEELEFTLDYDAIASWIYGGYLGQTGEGAPALLAIDEAAENAIVIFGDNDTMTAASMLGKMVDNNDGTLTITDDTNGLELTFGFEEGDAAYYMTMGEEMGTAELYPAEKADLLAALKGAIENYKHFA